MHKNAFEGVEIFAEVTGVADADGIALAAFDRGGNGFSADGRFDDVIHVADGETVASSGFAFDSEIEEVAACGTLSKSTAGIRKIAEGGFDFDAEILNGSEVRAEDFDAKLG